MKHKKLIIISIIIMSSVLLSGCWDKVEIDRKSLISSIAIDAGPDIGKEKELKKIKPDEPVTAMDLKKIHVTLGTPDISKLGPDKGGTAEDVYIDTDAYSMQDAVSKITIKSSRDIRFSHIKLLIIGSDLFTHPDTIKEVIDYLQRQSSINRTAMVVLAQGKAEDYIKNKPKMEKNIENYITGLMSNDKGSESVVTITLNDLLRLFSENGNAILPCISMDKDKKELKISGAAIIKDYRLKGYLSPTETSNLQILRGESRGAKKTIYIDGHPIDITIYSVDKEFKVTNSNGKLIFNINLQLESQLQESFIGENVFSRSKLSDIENNFNKSIKQELQSVLKITQQQFSVEPIGLREYVEKYHPFIWKQTKDKWEEKYKNAIINVNVNNHIRRIGVVE